MNRRAAFKQLPVDQAAQRVRELFDYELETGRLIRRRASGIARAGYVDLTIMLGYGFVAFDGTQVQAHRLIWLHQYGTWPEGVIDHIDGDPLNNRLCNLRDVPQGVNAQNQRKARSDNRSTGLLGAYRRKDTGRFTSRIKSNGKYLSLGQFDTAEEAHAAYVDAKRRLHEGCTL